MSRRSRSLQPLNSRLDSALEFSADREGLRVSRSDLMLSALQPQLPPIPSPGRSEEEMIEQESISGSNRSPLPSQASCSPFGRLSEATMITRQWASLSLQQSPSQCAPSVLLHVLPVVYLRHSGHVVIQSAYPPELCFRVYYMWGGTPVQGPIVLHFP